VAFILVVSTINEMVSKQNNCKISKMNKWSVDLVIGQ
jgi:hypothetical protein